LVASLTDHLRPDGSAFILASTVQSPARLQAIWAAWRAGGGTVRRVASRRLEGERIDIFRLRRRITRPNARRAIARPRGTGGHPRIRTAPRSG
jgi:hypothetical protein